MIIAIKIHPNKPPKKIPPKRTSSQSVLPSFRLKNLKTATNIQIKINHAMHPQISFLRFLFFNLIPPIYFRYLHYISILESCQLQNEKIRIFSSLLPLRNLFIPSEDHIGAKPFLGKIKHQAVLAWRDREAPENKH